jgi:hypothetical protein
MRFHRRTNLLALFVGQTKLPHARKPAAHEPATPVPLTVPFLSDDRQRHRSQHRRHTRRHKASFHPLCNRHDRSSNDMSAYAPRYFI